MSDNKWSEPSSVRSAISMKSNRSAFNNEDEEREENDAASIRSTPKSPGISSARSTHRSQPQSGRDLKLSELSASNSTTNARNKSVCFILRLSYVGDFIDFLKFRTTWS